MWTKMAVKCETHGVVEPDEKTIPSVLGDGELTIQACPECGDRVVFA